MASAANAADLPASADGFIRIPPGRFLSVLPGGRDDSGAELTIAPFALMTVPVSNAEFLEFVRVHPEWQRDRVPRVFAEHGYLDHWQGALAVASARQGAEPVTRVSWFAASAFCESRQARLPTWNEYEYVLAASATQRDGRAEPAWRERILAWYSRPSTGVLPAVGATEPNFYGVRDLHGVVWEWALDFNALMVSADNRDQGDPDRLKFCGEGALSVTDRENYPVLMRLALLSSLEAAHTTRNLGFRCARDVRTGAR